MTDEEEAINLLEEALFLRMNGEYAPGGTENWPDWDRKAETFLRRITDKHCPGSSADRAPAS